MLNDKTKLLHVIVCRLISFVEFQAFEALLCLPDSVYVLAFQLFDTNSSGFVTYGKCYVSLMYDMQTLTINDPVCQSVSVMWLCSENMAEWIKVLFGVETYQKFRT